MGWGEAWVSWEMFEIAFLGNELGIPINTCYIINKRSDSEEHGRQCCMKALGEAVLVTVQPRARIPQCFSLSSVKWGGDSAYLRGLLLIETWHTVLTWGTTNNCFQYVKCWDNICTAGTSSFDVQGCFSSITYTQGEGRVGCGSTVGVHAICTQLRHWSKGRSVTVVPDVEGDLSEGGRPAVREQTQPTPYV